MALDPIRDDVLRDALQPFRVNPSQFEAGVRARLHGRDASTAIDPLAGASPLLRSAAALLPLTLVAGGPVTSTVARSSGGFKIVSILTFPAVSLFVLLTATILSVTRIRRLQDQDHPVLGNQEAVQAATRLWWSRHRWGVGLVFGLALTLAWYGATWLLFLFLVGSMGILLLILTSLARRGLGDRQSIGLICLMSLMFLGQLTAFPGVGDNELHFLDQKLIPVVCYVGVGLLVPTWLRGSLRILQGRLRLVPWIAAGIMLWILVPLCLWFLEPVLRPATPARIKQYVESFDDAPYSSSSWNDWEIVARWAVAAGLKPDLTRPRQLWERSADDKTNPFVLGDALRVGLIGADEVKQLPDYQDRRKSLVDDPTGIKGTQPITSLGQTDWVIRAAVLDGSLTDPERDLLARRLHATFEALNGATFQLFQDAVLITHLLAVIDRPVQPDRYRARVHAWLLDLQSTAGGGFQIAGGFKTFRKATTASNDATEYAVELMTVYGVPAGLDMNWVRSFLRPTWNRLGGHWIIAVARNRFNALPGLPAPTWIEILSAERTLIATVVLIGLCLYATWAAPRRS